MMSLFPTDQPLSRTWSMATQMAWETAKPFVSFFAAVTFFSPVCSALTILSFSLFHPSVPFNSHPLLSSPHCFSDTFVALNGKY
ncbi:hypothetical protein FQN60_018172 [Etheostoma spectabile]|uniref:Uncharacterized protein n=1 Tax=Etheostoma spectabile TaxID=54343 RepID=A0A5J5DH90_9PERO|nr:hypothetical protein FQN60_018172 [Etheostoma spectabile]